MDREYVSRLVEQVRYMGRKAEETGTPISTDRELQEFLGELDR